jgi:TctA family transporter
MMALGIPSNAAIALLLSAMLIHGLQPGPALIAAQPNLFWGLTASLWLGSIVLVVFSFLLIQAWIKIVKVPYQLLYPAILGFCAIGVYSVSNSIFDIYLMCGFGLLGYIFKKLDSNPTPMLLGFVVAPLFEVQFRQSMVLSRGDYSIFLTRPASATMLLLIPVLVAVFWFLMRSSRQYADG